MIFIYINVKNIKSEIESSKIKSKTVEDRWFNKGLQRATEIIDAQSVEKPAVVISKEDFVKYINTLHEKWDVDDKAYKLGIDLIDMPSCEQIAVDLLELIMGVEETIGWWCYEEDFGKNFNIGDLVDGDIVPDLSTAEYLYDYLTGNPHTLKNS